MRQAHLKMLMMIFGYDHSGILTVTSFKASGMDAIHFFMATPL